MKNQNGITITTLILAVIILIILASISVNTLISDDESALRAVNDLGNNTNTTLEKHNGKISNIINEIKGTNIN